jgi:cephalosporin hydroxylase
MNIFMENNLDMPLAEVLKNIQNRIMTETTYFGVTALKSPMDFWVYQEIIFDMKPDIILEIGNNQGGSTLALAHMCDLLKHGKVIGLDIDHRNIPEIVTGHSRITLIEGDACESFGAVRRLIAENDRVLIIEDSSHTYENTLNVLNTYSSLTKRGDYFIVEDSICYHGLEVGPKPGPYEAVEKFISESDCFEIDRTKESFLITWNPKGYLKRK